MQWRADRDDELIEMTARLFEGKPVRWCRTDWAGIGCVVVGMLFWIAVILAVLIAR